MAASGSLLRLSRAHRLAFPPRGVSHLHEVLGLILCGVLAPFAWSTANSEISAINEGRRSPANLGTANTGKVLGIIGTVFLGIAVVSLVLLFLGLLPFFTGDEISQVFTNVGDG